MLSIVCWKWRPYPGYRSTFTATHVNTLCRMVARHYAHPHRFLCVTDDPVGLSDGVEYVPLWNDFSEVPNPWGMPRNPSCYRRLRAFHPGIAETFGPRFVSLDLDTVILGDMAPLWDRAEDFVIWGDTNPQTHYNGSMFLLKSGSRAKVWTRFDPTTSPQLHRDARHFGSDQGWISYVLGSGEARWTKADGVYSYRNELAPHGSTLPADARVVFFHGQLDPWSSEVQARCAWVRAAYR